ncbi:MAG: paraquat-inducible protein B [Halieaceae bacterium]|jgi:paraquat-inducible protein B
MSERSSSVLVGAFVVGAIVIAVAGALFVAGSGIARDRAEVVMVFDGSIRGLTVGAPVALRGVTVGQVTEIELIVDTDKGEITMAVVAAIEPRNMQLVGPVSDSIAQELVKRGLHAQLNTQSLLTGLLYVQLDFNTDKEARLAPLDSPYPQIPTVPTELEQLRSALESIDYAAIAADIHRIAGGLDTLLNSDDMQALPGTLRQTLVALESASEQLEMTLEQSSPRLAALLDQGDAALAVLNTQLPGIGAAVTSSLQQLDSVLADADSVLLRLDRAAAPDSAPRQQLSATVQELSLAARALRSLARSLEEHPEALLRGRKAEE